MTIYDAAVRSGQVRRRNLMGGQKRSVRISAPPPLKGLNTRAPINQLGPDEAYELVNWVPDTGAMRLREGSGAVQSAPASATSLMTWSYQGSDRLIWSYAISGGYTLRTTDDLAVDARTLNGTDWSSTMFNGTLVMVNGVDIPSRYDGLIYPGLFGTLTISGPTNPANFTGVKVFKSRLYYWSASELGFWYGAVNAVGGALTYFPLETVSQMGGYVMSINTWSQDAGSGPDDFIVITTSRGEVLVYQGSNPNDANDWAMVGRFRIGAPLDKNAFLEVDGRIYVLTQTDLEVLPDKFVRQQPLSRLSGAIRENIQSYGQIGGYRLFYDPVRDRVLLNIPTATNTYDQLVKTSFGYTRFTGVNARSYSVYNDEVYFLRGTQLWRWGGTKDGVANITFSAKSGYTMLGGNGEKRVAMYRPKLRSSGEVTVTTGLAYDHSGAYFEQSHTMTAGNAPWGSPWGTAWDSGTAERADWLVGVGTGQAISMSLSGSTGSSLEWMGSDYELVAGGGY